MPTGSVRRSVVRPATVTGDWALSVRRDDILAPGSDSPYAPRSRAATQVSGTAFAACHVPSVTRSTVLAAVATRTRPSRPAGPAPVLRTAIRSVLAPGRSAAARST